MCMHVLKILFEKGNLKAFKGGHELLWTLPLFSPSSFANPSPVAQQKGSQKLFHQQNSLQLLNTCILKHYRNRTCTSRLIKSHNERLSVRENFLE